jgi:hypothetical protein
MTEQATAPAPAAAPQSPVAGIKAFLSAQEAAPAERPEAGEADASEETSGIAHTDSPAEAEAPADETETKEPKSTKPATPEKDADSDETETDAESVEDDAAEIIAQLSSLKDLAEATGIDAEKLLDLQLPTKIDGKEGTARIRDLQRSYQLDAHINQKLATFDNDRKAFEAQRSQVERQAAERLQSLEQGLAILDRQLQGELASVNWQELQTTNPAEFNSKYVAYQHRFGQAQTIAQQLAAERQRQQANFQASQKAWLEEQGKLLKIKVPDWSDDVKRTQDRAAVAEYLKGYGIDAKEFEQVQDHRYLAVLRDAWKWAELQKQKPATLKKIKVAPKILRAGSKQSREARDDFAAKGDAAKLQRSGKVRDAIPVLRRTLFGK